MSWDDEEDQQENPWAATDWPNRPQARRWKRVWKGPSPESLWRLYSVFGPGMIECPDCGRPHGGGMDDFNGFCFNCHTENTRPGWQAEGIAQAFPSTKTAQGKETSPLTEGAGSKRFK